jgi:hypothetical protein
MGIQNSSGLGLAFMSVEVCVHHRLYFYTLGPLYTQAKSRDPEIVRAQRKCPKVVPTHLQNHVVWSRALKCSVKSYVTGVVV